jgi:hypothetical protein
MFIDCLFVIVVSQFYGSIFDDILPMTLLHSDANYYLLITTY